jgi:hypothetical protein
MAGDMVCVDAKRLTKKQLEMVTLESYAIAKQESSACEIILKQFKDAVRQILGAGERAFRLGDGTEVLMKLRADGTRTFLSPLELHKSGKMPLDVLLRCCSISAKAVDALQEDLVISNHQAAEMVVTTGDGTPAILCTFKKN